MKLAWFNEEAGNLYSSSVALRPIDMSSQLHSSISFAISYVPDIFFAALSSERARWYTKKNHLSSDIQSHAIHTRASQTGHGNPVFFFRKGKICNFLSEEFFFPDEPNMVGFNKIRAKAFSCIHIPFICIATYSNVLFDTLHVVETWRTNPQQRSSGSVKKLSWMHLYTAGKDGNRSRIVIPPPCRQGYTLRVGEPQRIDNLFHLVSLSKPLI